MVYMMVGYSKEIVYCLYILPAYMWVVYQAYTV